MRLSDAAVRGGGVCRAARRTAAHLYEMRRRRRRTHECNFKWRRDSKSFFVQWQRQSQSQSECLGRVASGGLRGRRSALRIQFCLHNMPGRFRSCALVCPSTARRCCSRVRDTKGSLLEPAESRKVRAKSPLGQNNVVRGRTWSWPRTRREPQLRPRRARSDPILMTKWSEVAKVARTDPENAKQRHDRLR